jgi:hypothetical protein
MGFPARPTRVLALMIEQTRCGIAYQLADELDTELRLELLLELLLKLLV